MTAEFVHLRLHSEFSLVDGLVRIKPLVKHVADLAMPAVAMTDYCNLYGLVKFFTAALAAGVKPVCGSDLWIEAEQEDAGPYLLTLLVQNNQGYKNLINIISKAYLEGQHNSRIWVKKTWLEAHSDGLIVLSGAKQGNIGQALLAGEDRLAEDLLTAWMALFPNRFYVELQRTGRTNDEDYLHKSVILADRLQCPLVATNDVRFLQQQQFEAHEARVCIHDQRTLSDPRRVRVYSDQQYLRSAEEMVELFSDIPDAIQNTVEIARRCNLQLELGKVCLPNYPVPDGMTMDNYFADVSWQGLEKRLNAILDRNAVDFAEQRKPYDERLKFELDIICKMGFPGYFLIVMEFISWAKNNGVPVGPGRGSGAGSVVAYALEITDLDPLAYDLLFERFLNPERVSMPDFDVDFCMDGRDRVIAHVADLYGQDAVSQIITFGTMAAKAVVRDVARVQGKSYGLADKLSKMIPFEPGITLAKALEKEPKFKEFIEQDEEAQEIMEMAEQLEGVTRNVGKHAGGVVIAPTKLTDFSPLYCDELGEGLVTQYDKNDIESAGLVKFDFLGLRTLTIVDWAILMINDRQRESAKDLIDITQIPLDDSRVFGMLQNGETTGVFQLESRGMKDLIKRLKPSCFEDIVALVALFRPGPLQSGMVDDFINRKHGRADVNYPHEDLEPVLENTYGVILYQEQVMQIAQVLGNYSFGQADMLRRAMGKKKPEEMAKQRVTFVEGAVARNVNKELAGSIFDLMEKFAGYGFNKSHSAAYALVSYQTAWLKYHFPAEFMSAVLSSDMQNTDKIVILVEECRHMGLTIINPDVNQSCFKFTVNKNNEIVYGLGAIKGLGEGPIDAIIDARKEAGDFKNLFDFCQRMDLSQVNKRSLEALIYSGVVDNLGPNRAVLRASMNDAIKAAEQKANSIASGYDNDLFGAIIPENNVHEDVYLAYANVRNWRAKERLSLEKDTLGLYLSGHPVDEYLTELKVFTSARLVDLKPDSNNQIMAGLVVGLRTMKSKKGDNIAFITLDDRSGRMEVSVFSEVYEQNYDKLQKDVILVIEGMVNVDDYSGGQKVIANNIYTLPEARMRFAKHVMVKLQEDTLPKNFPHQLADAISSYRNGYCPVFIDYEFSQVKGVIRLGNEWQVQPSDELLQRLRDFVGLDNVYLQYQ